MSSPRFFLFSKIFIFGCLVVPSRNFYEYLLLLETLSLIVLLSPDPSSHLSKVNLLSPGTLGRSPCFTLTLSFQLPSLRKLSLIPFNLPALASLKHFFFSHSFPYFFCGTSTLSLYFSFDSYLLVFFYLPTKPGMKCQSDPHQGKSGVFILSPSCALIWPLSLKPVDRFIFPGSIGY